MALPVAELPSMQSFLIKIYQACCCCPPAAHAVRCQQHYHCNQPVPQPPSPTAGSGQCSGAPDVDPGQVNSNGMAAPKSMHISLGAHDGRRADLCLMDLLPGRTPNHTICGPSSSIKFCRACCCCHWHPASTTATVNGVRHRACVMRRQAHVRPNEQLGCAGNAHLSRPNHAVVQLVPALQRQR